MYLTPVSQPSCKCCHGIRGLCTKNNINHKFWANFDKCYGMASVRALLIKVEIYWDMKGSHLTFLYNF